MSKIQNFAVLVCMLSVANAWGAGFMDDFNRPDGDVGNDWTIQTDGTITVQIVDNEVLIAGTQATDWVRCGISRDIVDESMVSCDFMMPGGFNFHIRVDDTDTGAYFEVYTWGGNLDHANSEDGGWPGWVAIPNASPIADEYNNIMLELIGNEITVTLNDTVVGTFTNANLTNIRSVLISSDSAADTTGSLIIDNVRIGPPPAVHPATGEPLVIDCLRGTPDAIDGDLSDWDLEAMTPAVLDGVEQLFSGQDSWAGPEDCSGEFYLLWDDENIYMAVVVKDEKLSMNKTGGDIWNADAVEVFFATTNAVAGHAEHYQYGFNANNQRWNWCNMDGAGSIEPDYLQIASTVTADGYICEASVSYGQMPSLDFSAGNTIGFHPVLDDTDDGDRELQMTWTGREAHDQSLGYGHMILLAEAEPEPAPANVVLRVDFNSNQDGGGDSTTASDPGLSEAAHNQEGWSSYHANHEVMDEFATADYGGITVTPDWPNTTDNRVRQSIDRGSDYDINWDDAAGDLNLVTDWIGIDTRTGNGGNGDWDGTTGTPTYMTLALGGLAAGNYNWTSFHHDTEHCHGPFAVWLSTDGGVTFTQLDDGVMTDSTPGGTPDSGATEVGPDANSLSSTYRTSFSADGVNDVVFRFAPYSEGAVHRQIWGMNGFVLELVPPVDPGADGLVASYALENDVLDGSGNGNDGTIVGNPTWIPGVQGTALEFHGLGAPGGGGDYIDCGNDASLDIPGPISLALWIRPDADDPEGQGTETAPMAKAMSGVGWSWQVRYGWGSPQPYMAFTFNTSPRAWAYVGQNLEQGEWAHIACSHDGATLKCYLDGAQTDSTPMGQITSSEAPVLIGSDGWGCDWIGAIDEVKMYDRGLSDGEILYLAGFRENLVQNASFEEDEAILDDPDWAQWCTWNPAEGAGSNATIVDTESIHGTKSLRIEPKGIENWHFIVLSLPIFVDMDKNYDVSFWAKAEAPRPLTLQLKAEDNSINAWGATDFELTTEWAEYHYTSEVLIDIVKLEILCSGTEVPFWLDLVSVCEGN